MRLVLHALAAAAVGLAARRPSTRHAGGAILLWPVRGTAGYRASVLTLGS